MEHPRMRRKRAENWSVEEKSLLRQLMRDSRHIFEKKSNKTDDNLQKAQEWRNVTNKFNQKVGKNRSIYDVKLAWKRIKMALKKGQSIRPHMQLTESPEKFTLTSPRINGLNIKLEKGNDRTIDDFAFMRRNLDVSTSEIERKQLEMLEVEHNYNVKIAELKIKKLQLQIQLLEGKKDPDPLI